MAHFFLKKKRLKVLKDYALILLQPPMDSCVPRIKIAIHNATTIVFLQHIVTSLNEPWRTSVNEPTSFTKERRRHVP